MKKWNASEEAKKITVIIFTLCIVLSVQIIGFLNFNKKLYDMSLEQSMKQVNELEAYMQKNIQLELERHVNVLKVTKLYVEKEKGLSSDEIVNQLKKVHEISDFKLMGYSDLDGEGLDSAGESYNISYEHMREHIENNEVYISNVLKNGSETLIFIAVPLKIKDGISGVLWGKCALADIMKKIEFPDDSYKYFQIVDDNGNYLLPSKNPFALNNDFEFAKKDIWEELEQYQIQNGISVKKIHERVQAGKDGDFCFEVDGQERYVSYRPLGINRWYLFSVQVDEGLHAYVGWVYRIAGVFFIILVIGLLIIFGMIYNLIYSMYKKIVKQNRETQAINAMFWTTLEQTKDIPFIIDSKLQEIAFYGYPTKNVVQYCSFADMEPDNMLKKGLVDKKSLKEYQKLYQSLVVEQKSCDPTIIYSPLGKRKEWLRINIISDEKENTDQIIGVLENYGEQKKKDLKIEKHLDDIKKMEKKSQRDFLTGLYNRETFLSKIQTALQENEKNQQKAALLILDLDYFKEVNDCMGHGMGDDVLQKTAITLRNFFRKEDILGRLGGDEFVIYVQNIKNVSAFQNRIKELNKLLCKVYHKDDKSVRVSVSIGIVFTDSDNLTFNVLYEKADKALYKVKHSSRNGYHIYSENES